MKHLLKHQDLAHHYEAVAKNVSNLSVKLAPGQNPLSFIGSELWIKVLE